MARYRVKAYFMHEHEEAAAQQAVQSSLITSPEWTQGYVIGVVNEKDVAALRQQGLVVTSIEKVAAAPAPRKSARKRGGGGGPRAARSRAASTLPTPGALTVNQPLTATLDVHRRQTIPVASESRKPKDKILSSHREHTDYYIVRLHGPLTPQRRKELDKLGVHLLERRSRNKYTMRLEPTQVDACAKLEFVDTVRLYGEDDTMVPAPMRAVKRRPAPERKASMYSVRLHRQQDMPTVVKWLENRRRKPLWTGRVNLRVVLLRRGRDVTQLAKLPEVALIEEAQVTRLFDSFARKLLRLPEVAIAPAGLTGAGEVIAVADTGLDDSHPDFAGRIVAMKAWGRKDDTSDPNGHGTHVSGCALGDGSASNGEVVGAAPGARLFLQSILDKRGNLGGLPEDLAALFREAYKAGARIHNNSWGAFVFARYSITSLQTDAFVAAHPDMLVVIAAGNDGIGVPRTAGGKMLAKNGFVDWPCVGAPGTAKNAITVGASRSSRPSGGFAKLTWGEVWSDRYPSKPISGERISSDAECIAAFSSRGPVDDSRIKPDVVAPGTDIAAARSKDAPLRNFWGAYPNNPRYGFMGGTSMAAPYVAGCAALVREWYRTKAHWTTPSAALIKATLINGTRRLKGKDALAEILGEPNFHQGFGRIDMADTLPNATVPAMRLEFDDTWKQPARILQDSGNRMRYRVQVGAGVPLRICLAWTDHPASGLQNRMVLLVDDGQSTKWIGNDGAAAVLSVSGNPLDPHNNVQVVRVQAPRPGNYTIVVTAVDLLFPPQTYALVVTGDLQSSLQAIP